VGDGTSGKKLTISDVCLHVSEPDANVQGSRFLPQFDCLILSPANLWHNQKEVSTLLYGFSFYLMLDFQGVCGAQCSTAPVQSVSETI